MRIVQAGVASVDVTVHRRSSLNATGELTQRTSIMMTLEFRLVKRGQYFWYRGQQWKRTRGHFAVPVRLVGTGGYEVVFDIHTQVKGELSK